MMSRAISRNDPLRNLTHLGKIRLIVSNPKSKSKIHEWTNNMAGFIIPSDVLFCVQYWLARFRRYVLPWPRSQSEYGRAFEPFGLASNCWAPDGRRSVDTR